MPIKVSFSLTWGTIFDKVMITNNNIITKQKKVILQNETNLFIKVLLKN
jgi:hypothetical protein